MEGKTRRGVEVVSCRGSSGVNIVCRLNYYERFILGGGVEKIKKKYHCVNRSTASRNFTFFCDFFITKKMFRYYNFHSKV